MRALPAAALAAAAGAAVLTVAPGSAPAQAPSAMVGAFPIAGTPTASPQSTITLRGISPDQVGTVTVTGSVTGLHTLKAAANPDGRGVTFTPDKAFNKDGEQVTVATDLPIAGSTDGDYTFTVSRRPSSGLGSTVEPDPKLLLQETGQVGELTSADPTYSSRPDLTPPQIQVFKRASKGLAPGLLFLAPKKVFSTGIERGLVKSGPMIVDDHGGLVYFNQELDQGNVTDFRVQQFEGKPALTWWQGRAVLGTGEGVVKVVGQDYRDIATVRGGNGYQLDFHEARLTPQGTLLTLVYNPVAMDLRPYGGSKDGRVVDAVIQELDVRTGQVLFEWHSLKDISLKESHEVVPKEAGALYDYVHINAASLTPDGNILISGRETWAGYVLDRTTGQLLKRIGGKKSDYAQPKNTIFAYQHDIQERPDGTVTVFDNQGAPKVPEVTGQDQTRGLVLELDDAAKTMSRVTQYQHKPSPLSSGTQGNVQDLPNGNVLMEWGSQGYLTEFSKAGSVLLDLRIARGQDSYRGYRSPWVGQPVTPPTVATKASSVFMSWNGATQVKRWRLLTGTTATSLKAVATSARTGFETRITLKTPGKLVAVQALDASGAVLGTSIPKEFKR